MKLEIDYKGKKGIIHEAFSLCVDNLSMKDEWNFPQNLEISETIDYSLIKNLFHQVKFKLFSTIILILK